MEAHSVLPSTGLEAPAGSQPLLSRVPGIGLQTWDQSTARSSLLRGWFPCSPAVLGNRNAQGKPHSTFTCLYAGGQLQGRPGLAGAFWAQTEQHSGCGAASPSQGHRVPDSLRAALSLGGEAPAWECSLGRFLSLGKSSPCGRLWQFVHPQPLSPLQGGLAPRSEGKARAELRQQSGTTHVSHPRAACSYRGSEASFSVPEAHLLSLL